MDGGYRKMEHIPAINETFSIDSHQDAVRYGLRAGHLNGLRCHFTFEDPVAVNRAGFMGECEVGHLTYIGSGSSIVATRIGRFGAIAPHASVGSAEHPTDWLSVHPFQYKGTANFRGSDWYENIVGDESFLGNKRATVIGNDVWLGERVFIKRGVVIGDGAIVAAGSVVTKNVEPYAIVGGIPAKLIRYRFPEELVERLLRISWWNYDLSPIRKNLDFKNPAKAADQLEEALNGNLIQALHPPKYRMRPKEGKWECMRLA